MQLELFTRIQFDNGICKLVTIRIKLDGFNNRRINLLRDLRVSVNAGQKYKKKKIPRTPHTTPIIA
jgi:hypothetical protein